MKKFLFILFIIFPILLIARCNMKMKFDFLQETSEISMIEIATYEDYDYVTDEPIVTTLCIIEDVEKFINAITLIDFYKGPIYMEAPVEIREGSTIIKVSYNNGDYELIAATGRAMYRYTSDYYNPYVGYGGFDEDEFLTIISLYVEQYT